MAARYKPREDAAVILTKAEASVLLAALDLLRDEEVGAHLTFAEVERKVRAAKELIER